MIAYNTHWLDALAVKEQSRKWFNKGLISDIQLQTIQAKFQSEFYTPNIFVRIGLGIFCWILISSIFGLFGVALIADFKSETSTGIICLLFGASLLAILEFLIKNKRYYRAGIDDAMLHMAISFVIVGCCLLFSPAFEDKNIFYFLMALPLLVAAAIRYTDTIAAIFAFACLVAIIFLLLQVSRFTVKFIPIACMLLSAGIYYWITTNKNKEAFRYWTNCLAMIEACCLLLFYVSGNYFVVEDVGKMLLSDFHVPFSIIFWLFTAITPLAYVYFGLKNHDRLLLRIGLVMIALTVITFKYYFSLGHHEVTLTVAGAILVLVAYTSIRYLKSNPGRYTYIEDKSDENISFQNTEALIIAQTAGSPVAQENEFGFGGGRFGGGGSGGNY